MSTPEPSTTSVAPLWTTDDTATYLNISARHVRRLVASGELQSVQIGRSIRIPPHAVDAFIERNTRKEAA